MVSILSVGCGWIAFVTWLPRYGSIHVFFQNSKLKFWSKRSDGAGFLFHSWYCYVWFPLGLWHRSDSQCFHPFQRHCRSTTHTSSRLWAIFNQIQQLRSASRCINNEGLIIIKMHKLWRIQWFQWNVPPIHGQKKNFASPRSEASTVWWLSHLVLSRTPDFGLDHVQLVWYWWIWYGKYLEAFQSVPSVGSWTIQTQPSDVS